MLACARACTRATCASPEVVGGDRVAVILPPPPPHLRAARIRSCACARICASGAGREFERVGGLVPWWVRAHRSAEFKPTACALAPAKSAVSQGMTAICPTDYFILIPSLIRKDQRPTHTHTHTHTHSLTHAGTHTHTQAHTRTRRHTHARAHARTLQTHTAYLVRDERYGTREAIESLSVSLVLNQLN